jgi:hypothetical protein
MLQNQHDMIEKLSDIESRLLDLEARCTLNQRSILIGNNGHSIKNSINNSHHLLHKLNNNNKNHLYNNIKNNNNSEANNSEANNSDNNSTNNYDQDFNNEEQVDRINDNDNDTYNENNESMGSNNDSLEYNDQSQQSLNMSNNFAANPNINLNNPNLLSDTEVKRIFSLAKSRGNFAALIVQQLYGKHERVISNVMGTRGKRQLSPRRINIVKKLTFNMYPAASQVEEEMLWKKECVKAIDSKNRKVKIEPGSFDHISRAAGIQAMTNLKFQEYQMN